MAKADSPLASAFTVLAKVPAAVPAVKTPAALMVPPPAFTLHTGVTATALPFASRPVAAKATVPPASTVAAAGATVSCESAPA